MQSRRDHVHAYQFAVSRLSTALTGADPGTGEAPFRRAGLGTLLGILIAVLLSAAAAIFGWLAPAASTTWRQPGSIVVEKETGTRFLYLGGMLHPTMNYVSARLIAGHTASVTYLPSSTLDAVPVGDTIGIPGAPQSLPPASALLPGRWVTCLAPGRPGGLTLSLRAGRATGLGGARALVTGPGGGSYVIWDNVKYPLPQHSALVALGLGNSVPVPAPAAWLAAVRTGPALAAPAVAGVGRSMHIAGRRSHVGQLFASTSGGVRQYYVLLTDGLAPISRIEFTLMAAVPGVAPPTQVSPADIAAMPASADGQMLSRLPGLLTGPLYQPGDPAATLCVRQVSPGRPGYGTVVTEPASLSAVDISAHAGLLAQPPAAPGSVPGAPSPQYLISGTGKKYLLDSQAITALGYPGSAVRVMPASILQLVPDGPMLSAAQAEKAATWASG